MMMRYHPLSVMPVHWNTEFGVAMAKTDVDLQKAVNEAMKQLKDEGFFEENQAKWFA